jgi:hypothetical protein
MGEMVGKASISHKLRRVPCNYIFFETFGGKHGFSIMHLMYVRGITSIQLVCVCKL